MTLWIIMRTWIKKYVFLYLFAGTLPYRGEMRLGVIYPIPLSMHQLDARRLPYNFFWERPCGKTVFVENWR